MIAPPPPVAPSPPPCWCGQPRQNHTSDHTPPADHDYAPAQGVESEAYDAW